jgi:hypothetical protein
MLSPKLFALYIDDLSKMLTKNLVLDASSIYVAITYSMLMTCVFLPHLRRDYKNSLIYAVAMVMTMIFFSFSCTI